MATTQVELVTPTGTLYSGQAEMVVCRTEGGDIAFLANHMPYLGALGARSPPAPHRPPRRSVSG